MINIGIGIGGSVKSSYSSSAVSKTQVVSELPETGKQGEIYLVRNNTVEGDNLYNEYIYVNDKWERLGSNIEISDEILSQIPTKTSQLVNDSNYVTNPENYYTKDELDRKLEEDAFNWEDA